MSLARETNIEFKLVWKVTPFIIKFYLRPRLYIGPGFSDGGAGGGEGGRGAQVFLVTAPINFYLSFSPVVHACAYTRSTLHRALHSATEFMQFIAEQDWHASKR